MSEATHAGAAALKALLRQLGDKAEADLGAHFDAHPERDGEDARDYRAMAAMVQSSIEHNMHHQDPAHREGYLRALTDLLSMVADGSGPGPTWAPIHTTAASFAG